MLLLEVLQNLLMSIRPIARFAQLCHSTGLSAIPNGPRQTFELYTRLGPMTGKDILEIGPGQTAEVLTMALKAGAKSCIAVDVVEYLTHEDTWQKQIEYVVYDGNRLPFESRRFDLICAHTAFEHLHYPAVTVAECFRVLRAGGHLVTLVDLGDHSYYGRQIPQPLKLFDCLRYPEWLWNLMKWNRSSYTNRLRKSDWIRLFTEAGFVIRHQESCTSTDIAGALPSLPYLRRYSYDDAVTSMLTVWLEKPTDVPSPCPSLSRPLLKQMTHGEHTLP